MIAYADSSAILRTILSQSGAFGSWKKCSLVATSALAWVECSRTIERLRLESSIDDKQRAIIMSKVREFFDQLVVFDLNELILEGAAGSFPTIVGTLDAIHLCTAISWKSSSNLDVFMVSHDEQLNTASLASGLRVP